MFFTRGKWITAISSSAVQYRKQSCVSVANTMGSGDVLGCGQESSSTTVANDIGAPSEEAGGKTECESDALSSNGSDRDRLLLADWCLHERQLWVDSYRTQLNASAPKKRSLIAE